MFKKYIKAILLLMIGNVLTSINEREINIHLLICEKDAKSAYEEFFNNPIDNTFTNAAKRNSAFLAICVSHLSPITWKKVLHRDNIPTVIEFRPDAAVGEKDFWCDVFTYEYLRGGEEFGCTEKKDLTNLMKEKSYLSGYFINERSLDGLNKNYFREIKVIIRQVTNFPKPDFITKLHISILKNIPDLDAKVAEGLRESIRIRY